MDDLREVLEHVDPALLDYQDWVAVGMALKEEGLTAADWEAWSARDVIRYKPGECYRKWTSFQGPGLGKPVKAGTLMQLAKDQGWRPEPVAEDGVALDWDSVIGSKKDDRVVVDQGWLESRDLEEPADWNPVQDITKYLETLFEASENVGYVTETWQKDGKYLPSKGSWSRTAGELLEALGKCGSDITDVFGTYKEEAGAWICFNPLDGKGRKNENVTDYRYALVESDAMDLGKQHAILRELELPIACLVYSGNKSIHAVVRVEATSYEEYQRRVNYLYAVCAKNGLIVDTQNKNPSRLSRMPGVTRKGQKQFLIDTNIGKRTWAEWADWIEGVNDDLPDPEPLAAVWDHLPDLAPPLIDGVLRQGHKMLLAGPSKAGKSYALIQLCIGIAEGKEWMSWPCAQGRVLYVNLELDRASCLHRFRDVYEALGLEPRNIQNIDIWNLRGKAVPMDKLAPKLIRRSLKRGYLAVVIDPIYKVITGDENSAGEMAHFANQFDKIATELGTAVIYCHHHSKGYQGGKKAMDRASGSGVFARDPDALLDLTELEVPKETKRLVEGLSVCQKAAEILGRWQPDYLDRSVREDELQSEYHMLRHLDQALTRQQLQTAMAEIQAVRQAEGYKTAWRIEGTLREFPTFNPVDVWFEYPRHIVDTTGQLENLEPECEKPSWERAMDKRKNPEKKKEIRGNKLEIAYANLEMEGKDEITTSDLAEEIGCSVRTVRNYIRDHGGFVTEKQADGLPSYVRRADDTRENPGK